MMNNSVYLHTINHDHAILSYCLLSSVALLLTLLKAKISRAPSYLFTSRAALAVSANPQ